MTSIDTRCSSTARCCSSPMTQALLSVIGVLVTVLGHCQALPYEPVAAYVKDSYQMWQIPNSHSLSYLVQNPLSELWLGLHCHCPGPLGDSVQSTGSKCFTRTGRILVRSFRRNTLHLYLANERIVAPHTRKNKHS